MKRELLRMENITILNHDAGMLEQAWFYVGEGETVGVLGQYNSGRADLVRALCGRQRIPEARLYYQEEQQTEWDEETAMKKGIFCISDYDGLFLDFDVTFNIFTSYQTGNHMLVNQKNLHRQCRKFLDDLGISIPSDMPVSRLCLMDKLLVMISRAVALKAKLLVIDGLISTLDEMQLQTLQTLFAGLNQRDISIALFDVDVPALSFLADRVIVVRDGRIASNCRKEQFDEERLTTIMLGKELDISPGRDKEATDTPAVVKLYYKERTGRRLLFSVPEGSLTGIVVDTEAYTSKMERIFSGEDASYQVVINEKAVNPRMLERQIGLVHEHNVIFPNLDLEENITLCYQKISHRMLCINQRRNHIALNNYVKPFFRRELEAMYRVSDVSTLEWTEKKIVEICRNLIKNPNVMVYINPVYRLGSISSRRLLEKIRQLQLHGYTSVLVSENVQICTAVCNRILFLKDNSVMGEFFMDMHPIEEVLEFYRNEFWQK